ncbi:hypothetical protein ACFYO2_39950 [Streptomyces sp. NPDC006602]|uniref:hypothetical protein n=1 Tax=Streptomyces sp. NPDC006602 TaxID=3364751 RepID=UPI00368B1592
MLGVPSAGLSAARSLRKQGYDGRLVVIGEKPRRPYDRPPLSKEFLTGTRDGAELALGADVHRRARNPVAVLGLDRTRLLTPRRRRLCATVARVGSA